jgi:NADH:ubiquinone oxidoreductase subunit E
MVNFNNINNQNMYNLMNPNLNGNLPISSNKKEYIDSPKNMIHIDNILKSKDKRTTLIIRNIPNRYTISLLLEELKQNYQYKYDVVYLPQDCINNSNLGFGFINFIEHMYLITFYEEFTGKKWNCFNSNKRCQLAYSKCQGKNELIKYIHKKLGISSHYNNDENLKKSFYINDEKCQKPLIEIPIKYYKSFLSYYPFSLCHIKDDKVFVVDKYYNF